MVAQVGCYCGALLKGFQGFTKGDPFPPTIFNMVMYSVIWHCVNMVSGDGSGPKGFRRSVQWHTEFFYVGDGILASSNIARKQ